jgi:membrane protein YdbS with pleckstrin-like domain
LKNPQKRKPDALAAYRAAGDRLAKDGRRLLLIEAIIVSCVMVGVFVMLYQVFSVHGILFPMTRAEILFFYTVYYLLVCVLTLFVTLPLLFGLLRLSGKVEDDETPVLAELFYYFSSGRLYRRALSLSFGGFWRMLFVVLAVAATCGATVYFFPRELWAGFLCGVAVLVEIIVWLLFVLRRFATFAVAFYDEVPLKEARAMARTLAKCDRFGGLRFFFACLPRILLGLLTFGVYLLWDVLPRMGVAYFSYCKQMNDMIIRSEE